MEKNYFILILFSCLSAVIHSQNFTGNWNVVSLEYNGNTINLPSTVTTPPNIEFHNSFSSAPLDQYWGRYIYGNGICNSFTSYFENEQNNAISLIPYFETTDNVCTTTEETDFESLYFSILQEPGNLTYSFTNDLHNLSIINSLGDIINLGREDAPTNHLSGEWFLHSIWEFDILLENTFDPNLNIFFSDDIINGQSEFYGNSTCNGFNGTYDNPIQPNSFIRRSIAWTLLMCEPNAAGSFEMSYIQSFSNLPEDIFTFEITGSASDAMLTIYNSNGSELNYGRQTLSINSFTEQKTKLITDVSNHILQLVSDVPLVNNPYAIYDISGRLMTSADLDESQNIEIGTLASGSYILKIISSQNQTESFKFLKR